MAAIGYRKGWCVHSSPTCAACERLRARARRQREERLVKAPAPLKYSTGFTREDFAIFETRIPLSWMRSDYKVADRLAADRIREVVEFAAEVATT